MCLGEEGNSALKHVPMVSTVLFFVNGGRCFHDELPYSEEIMECFVGREEGLANQDRCGLVCTAVALRKFNGYK